LDLVESVETCLLADCFEPSASRAQALDQRMRNRLADSLAYIFGELDDILAVDRQDVSALVDRIRSAPQSPQIFGAYYDLVLAAEFDEEESARELARELIEPHPFEAFRIAGIHERPRHESDRLRVHFLEEEGIEAGDADDATISECRERIGAAFELLDAGFPEMAQEIRGLLREIVLAVGPEDPKALNFDGVSSYKLWGSVLLNARGQTSVLDTAQALAHESGHNLLFGFCADESLIENADEELFASPLRMDARPMDGVMHATYVVARMHQTLSRLLASGLLDEEQEAAARKDLVLHGRNFEAGDQTIREGARLTRTGRQAIEAARAYMASTREPFITSLG
jgi:hypothetical protein